MFGPRLGGRTVFGTGKAYGNISGAATYDAATGTWTVTGAATVDIDTITGAAVLMCKRIIVTGTGVLTVTTNCKGLLLFASVSVAVQPGGKVHIDKLGKAGNFGDLTPYDLLPTICRGRVHKAKLSAYVVKGEGAAGGAGQAQNVAGNPGASATAMQSGGGGSGGVSLGTGNSGKGGKGGSLCGGAGSGGSHRGVGTPDAGNYGGPGSDGNAGSPGIGPGGAGNPVGASVLHGGDYTAPEGAGGGFLALLSPMITVASGASVTSAGARGGMALYAGLCTGNGGSSGGGIILGVTRAGGYSNAGTVAAPGGAATHAAENQTERWGGAGGVGSVNIYQAA